MKTLAELPVSKSYPASAIRVTHEDTELCVRPTKVSDAEEIVRASLASLPELKRFMPWAHGPITLEGQIDRLRDCEAKYACGEEMVMGLFRGRELLTMVGLHPRVPLNPNGMEVGYWAPTPVSGKGFTTLAVRVVVLYAFDKLGVDRLQVMHDEANVASRRVIEKCGFAREGVLRNMTMVPTPELLEGGYQTTNMNPMYALFPDTVEQLSWVKGLRERVTYVPMAAGA